LFGLYLGGPVYAAVVVAIAAVALFETLRLLGLEDRHDVLLLGFLGAAAWLIGPVTARADWTLPAVASFSGLVLVRQVVLFPAATTDESARIGFAATYAGLPFAHFILLRATPRGFDLTLVAFLLTWAFDTAAYFGGLRWGRHKLAAAVSPGKTWEGACFGSAAALAVALLPLGTWPLRLGERVLAAVLVIVFGQLGDLFESAIKRHAGVKDSGRLLPGHGGVLDRFDSLMLTVPAVYYLAQLLPAGMVR
jgi:phosphatidate cytidylyltransferase